MICIVGLSIVELHVDTRDISYQLQEELLINVQLTLYQCIIQSIRDSYSYQVQVEYTDTVP